MFTGFLKLLDTVQILNCCLQSDSRSSSSSSSSSFGSQSISPLSKISRKIWKSFINNSFHCNFCYGILTYFSSISMMNSSGMFVTANYADSLEAVANCFSSTCGSFPRRFRFRTWFSLFTKASQSISLLFSAQIIWP